MRDTVESLKSKALSDNLAVTRIAGVEFGEEARWLLSHTETYYGIQSRCKELLEEVFHPYVNPLVAMGLMRLGILGDLWFYLQIPEQTRALKVLFDTYRHLFNKLVTDEQQKRFVTDLLDWVAILTSQNEVSDEILSDILQQLIAWEAEFGEYYYRFCGSFCKALKGLDNRENMKSAALGFVRHLYSQSLNHWQQSLASDLPLPTGFPPQNFLPELKDRLSTANSINELSGFPSFSEIAGLLREAVCNLENVAERINYLLYLLGLPAMEDLRDHLLWDLNRELARLYTSMEHDRILTIIDSVFDTLAGYKSSHRSIVLDCLLTIGKNVISNGNKEHALHFIRYLAAMEFTQPGQVRIRPDWQLDIDKNHLKHIRLYLELIRINPLFCKELLAALIIAVTRHGIFVSDEDLFQKDVSALLNANIKPVFIQLKHLLRQLPVFFNEIGAEGEIRERSTELDELSMRKDRLIHFLRKQVHTESNNTHIRLCVLILDYWTKLDPTSLEDGIPEDVLQYLKSGDELIQAQHVATIAFLSEHKLAVQDLLACSSHKLEQLFASRNQDPRLKRLHLLCKIHLLLKDKYELDPYDIVKFLAHYRFFDSREQNRLRTSLARRDYDSSVRQLLGYIGKLNSIILNPVPSQSRENIYYKRHIAAGIPSMYGTYNEAKLEAMGMVFRIENLVRRLFAHSLEQINLNYINRKNLRRIIRILELYDFAMHQEMLTNAAFSSAVAMLDSAQSISNCSLEQYIDIFRLLKDSVNEIISEYYFRFYDSELQRLAEGSKSKEDSEVFAEEFYRKLLSASFMVQGLDVFITRIVESLNEMRRLFRPADILKLMSYDPDKLFFHLQSNNTHIENQVLLGSKAYYLKRLWHYEYPIPPGFVITTELYRNRDLINTHPDISDEFDFLLKQNLFKLQKATGCILGDPHKPLLLSVRSGAPMSLPGAMDTFLNIGLNDESCLELSKQPNYGWTAWDCYRRLIQSWGMAYGIKRDCFDEVMLSYKKQFNIDLKTQFPNHLMQQMVEDYKELLSRHNIQFEQDPFLQLYKAISHVLDSWNTDRARLYRKKLQVAEEWGTAVIVQKMVMGNISLESGSGVLFTHAEWNPEPGICLNGDFTICSQGEDVVAGLVHTLPISTAQAKATSEAVESSLEISFPAIYNRLQRYANQLILDKNFPHQEIEFTFEGPGEEQLFILQTRNQVIQKVPDYKVVCPGIGIPDGLGTGIGIGKGALNGVIVINRSDIGEYARMGKALILVRPDTVPDDMELLFDCQGLLTARGGVTSHAAVTATRLGLIGIVNCWDLSVNEANSTCRIGSKELKAGDQITLDAGSGTIYDGWQALKSIHDLN